MPSDIARSALELETLVSRAARRGWVEIGELLEVYIRLRPGGHLHLAEDRRVDLEAMVSALETLPRGFVDAGDVLVVPGLAPYEHVPVHSGMLPAGLLADGTLLVEASFGHVSIVNLVAPLCVLAHEIGKAHALLVNAGLVAPDVPPPSVAVESAQFDPGELLDPGEAADPSGDEEPGDGQATAEPNDEPEAGELDESKDDLEVAAVLARLAFALGVDQATLEAADDRTEGALLRLLLSQACLPELRVHADLAPAATARRATDHANRILATLAEMGLMGRPTHLWLGGGMITECLSPYVRDLRQVLVRWAAENPDLCGDDLMLHDPAGEDLLYALAHDFLQSDDELVAERAVADRTVGIQRYDNGFEVIDLGRLEPAACDARLPRWPATPSPAPVLLRVTPELEDTDGSGTRALLRALAGQLASVSLLLEGTALSGNPGTIVLPQMAVDWAGEHKVFIPNATPLAPQSFLGFAGAAVQQGAVLSVTSAALLSPEHVGWLTRTYGVAAIEVGARGLVNALADARWSGELPAEVDVRWALVSTVPASSGRPSLPSLSGHAAVAISALRDMLAAPRTEAATAPASEPPPTPRRGRSLLIKA